MLHAHVEEFFIHNKKTGKMELVKSKKKKYCDECHAKNWHKIKEKALGK